MIGRRLSHYDIREKLGEGGMGVVYLARDIRLQRDVALKFLPPEFDRPGPERDRLLREGRAAAALMHPHVAAVHTIEEADGHVFIVMEYVDGAPLDARQSRSVEDVARIGVQLADGLQAAHERGIVHRDIKPTNLLRGKDGRLRITDFGLATMLGATRLTSTHATAGTLSYMSPEQVEGRPLDARSDLFSTGAVLYELATGRPAFAGDNAAVVLYAILQLEPPPMSAAEGTMPSGFEAIVRRCLAKRPEDRYPTAAALAEDLNAFLKGRGTSAEALPRPARPPTFRSRVRRSPWPRWAVGTVAVCAVIAAAVSAWW